MSISGVGKAGGCHSTQKTDGCQGDKGDVKDKKKMSKEDIDKLLEQLPLDPEVLAQLKALLKQQDGAPPPDEKDALTDGKDGGKKC